MEKDQEWLLKYNWLFFNIIHKSCHLISTTNTTRKQSTLRTSGLLTLEVRTYGSHIKNTWLLELLDLRLTSHYKKLNYQGKSFRKTTPSPLSPSSEFYSLFIFGGGSMQLYFKTSRLQTKNVEIIALYILFYTSLLLKDFFHVSSYAMS